MLMPTRASARDRRLIVAASTAESFALLGTLFFPALLPTFQAEWALSNTDAGWINGVFYAGYALASPLLIGLTDRHDPRRIYLANAVVGGVAMFGFAALASGFWTAALFQTLAGVAFAGVYMPGLKALTDRLEGAGEQSRAVAVYTACTGVGMALSVWLAGFVEGLAGWRWAAAVAGSGSVAAYAIFAACFRPKPPAPAPEVVHALLDFRPVFRNRLALGYVIGYAVHCWELFGARAWMVAFLAFAFALDAAAPPALTPQELATLAMLVGIPASLIGNEGAMRWGRRRMIAVYMTASGLIGAAMGLTAALPAAAVAMLMIVYGAATMADSASLTAGMVAAAHEGRRGMTMAVYSFVGFAMAFLGPLVFGVVLDLAGGGSGGWVWAFAVLGLVAASGPIWMRLLQGKWE